VPRDACYFVGSFADMLRMTRHFGVTTRYIWSSGQPGSRREIASAIVLRKVRAPWARRQVTPGHGYSP
jgi:hypothetical protein